MPSWPTDRLPSQVVLPHPLQPGPAQRAGEGSHRQQEVAPRVLHLHPPHHLYPAGRQHPAGASMQPEPERVDEADLLAIPDRDRDDGVPQTPFFQAAWTAGSALAAVGRGILGWTLRRARTA